MITGTVVARPTKEKLAADIAEKLGERSPYVSKGSSVDSTFLDAIHTALTGRPTSGADTYRKTEVVLDLMGLTYDPYWDTSEAAPKGGGTVTTRAFSRIRTALTGVPRCFIVAMPTAPTGTPWSHDDTYRFDDTVRGRKPLVEAGPESRIVYYETGRPGQGAQFVATATVAYIAPGWNGPWRAKLTDFQPLSEPVPSSEFAAVGWDRRPGITEVTHASYQALLTAGGVPPQVSDPIAAVLGHDESDLSVPDPGGLAIAERISADFPPSSISITAIVPETLPTGALTPPSPVAPLYYESTTGAVSMSNPGVLPPRSRNRERDRLAERRAVELTKQALSATGWTFSRDRQKDGVGYDLEFTRGVRRLKIEVKGIQGSDLAFNLTPKELWRATEDDEWALVAVTSVLSPANPQLHFVSRDRVLAGTLVVTGYRLRI